MTTNARPAIDQLDTTHAAVVARAKALAPILAEHAAESEAQRFVHPASITAMKDAGLFRILLPQLVGGYELRLRTMSECVTAVSQACTASGWALLVVTAHDWILGMFPEAGQREVYADSPDALVAGGLATQGRAVRADGGWTVSGRWQFASAVDHSQWLIMGSTIETSQPDDPKHVHVVVPTSDATIDDTWFTLGLRGTGSKDIVVDNVFVPDHRAAFTGTLFGGRGDGVDLHPTNLYRTPVLSGLALHLASATVGIALTAQQRFIDQTTGRAHAYTGKAIRESVGLQMRLAESDAEIRAAQLLTFDLCDQLSDAADSGEPADNMLRARTKWQAAYITQLCRRAIDRIFQASGARGVHDSSALQQLFRDLNTATHHATADPDAAAESYGRMLLGLSPGTYLL